MPVTCSRWIGVRKPRWQLREGDRLTLELGAGRDREDTTGNVAKEGRLVGRELRAQLGKGEDHLQ